MLAAQGELPIILMTGCGDTPTTVRSMKAGVVEFLVKPFCDNERLKAIPRSEILVNALCDQARRKVLFSGHSNGATV
jgi:FixJ family two-component response regulator